jgi:hypothetical protein
MLWRDFGFGVRQLGTTSVLRRPLFVVHPHHRPYARTPTTDEFRIVAMDFFHSKKSKEERQQQQQQQQPTIYFEQTLFLNRMKSKEEINQRQS